MTVVFESSTSTKEAKELARVVDLLGGTKVLHRAPRNTLDTHEMLLRGLPGSALSHFINRLVTLTLTASLEKAIGMSTRTYQRRSDEPMKLLTREQSVRTWKFAEILAKATKVFGSQLEAEQWLESPAIGLDQRCPLDLLQTPAGVDLVEDFLTRLEYSVYI